MRVPAIALMTVVLFSQAASAQTTTFSDYEAMDDAEQSRVVDSALARIYDGFQGEGREDVTDCMIEYFLSAPETGGLPRGYVRFANFVGDIKRSDLEPSEIPSIERILFNIVNVACLEPSVSDQ